MKLYTITYTRRRLVKAGERGGEIEADVPTHADVPNCYLVLDLPRAATASQIKDRYRELSKALHPDKDTNTVDKERLKLVNVAYGVLQDPEKRKSLDEQLDREDFSNTTTKDNPTKKPNAYNNDNSEKEYEYAYTRERQQHKETYSNMWRRIQDVFSESSLPSIKVILSLDIDSEKRQELIKFLLTRREELLAHEIRSALSISQIPKVGRLRELLNGGEITKEIFDKLRLHAQDCSYSLLMLEISSALQDSMVIKVEQINSLLKAEMLSVDQVNTLKQATQEKRANLFRSAIRSALLTSMLPSLPTLRIYERKDDLSTDDYVKLSQLLRQKYYDLVLYDIQSALMLSMLPKEAYILQLRSEDKITVEQQQNLLESLKVKRRNTRS